MGRIRLLHKQKRLFWRSPPTCQEVTRMIAKSEGFLGRKSDGNLGMTNIWRGWEKLSILVEMQKTFNNENLWVIVSPKSCP